ncbi:MAG: hypothetical protein ABEH64_02585 [Salinirussus sp.]
MDLEPIDIALWVWVVVATAAGVAMIIFGLGTILAIIGVILIIIGLVSILFALQSTLDELPIDFAK